MIAIQLFIASPRVKIVWKALLISDLFGNWRWKHVIHSKQSAVGGAGTENNAAGETPAQLPVKSLMTPPPAGAAVTRRELRARRATVPDLTAGWLRGEGHLML